MPNKEHLEHVLDLGCGPGFWTIELTKHGVKRVHAADLTEKVLLLAKERCQIYNCKETEFSIQNAESMTFANNTFDHVNCQGVIHHTPNTEAAVGEIARVLKHRGTASLSVYFKNYLLRNWKYLAWVGQILSGMGVQLKGRERENIFLESEVDEIVRLYDGKENPTLAWICKAC